MKKESGFTLIEIVMVLVLLGILSAVAVPKYFDLQAQAKQRAAQAAVAEAQARVNAIFAQELLKGVACSKAVGIAKTGVSGVAMGEWKVTFDDDGEISKVERKSGASEVEEISMTDLVDYTPKIAIPSCTGS